MSMKGPADPRERHAMVALSHAAHAAARCGVHFVDQIGHLFCKIGDPSPGSACCAARSACVVGRFKAV